MSPNTMIYAMLILVVALNMCKNNQDNDSSTTLLYIILIGGIIFTLNNFMLQFFILDKRINYEDQ